MSKKTVQFSTRDGKEVSFERTSDDGQAVADLMSSGVDGDSSEPLTVNGTAHLQPTKKSDAERTRELIALALAGTT